MRTMRDRGREERWIDDLLEATVARAVVPPDVAARALAGVGAARRAGRRQRLSRLGVGLAAAAALAALLLVPLGPGAAATEVAAPALRAAEGGAESLPSALTDAASAVSTAVSDAGRAATAGRAPLPALGPGWSALAAAAGAAAIALSLGGHRGRRRLVEEDAG